MERTYDSFFRASFKLAGDIDVKKKNYKRYGNNEDETKVLVTKSSVFFTLLSFFFPPNSVKITVAPPIRFPRKFTRNFNSMVFRSFAINNTRIVTWTASVINECDNVASNNALVFSPVLAYVYETSFRLLFRRPIWSFYSLFFLSFLLLFSTSLPRPLFSRFLSYEDGTNEDQDTSVSFPLSPDPGHKRINYAIESRSNDIIYSPSRPIRGTVITRLSRQTGRSRIRFSILDCDRFTNWK